MREDAYLWPKEGDYNNTKSQCINACFIQFEALDILED